jgi:hypothetical protein
MAGAKIVDGDANPERLQDFQLFFRSGALPHERGLSDTNGLPV